MTESRRALKHGMTPVDRNKKCQLHAGQERLSIVRLDPSSSGSETSDTFVKDALYAAVSISKLPEASKVLNPDPPLVRHCSITPLAPAR